MFTVRQNGSNVIDITAVPPPSGRWVCCYTTWYAAIFLSKKTRKFNEPKCSSHVLYHPVSWTAQCSLLLNCWVWFMRLDSYQNNLKSRLTENVALWGHTGKLRLLCSINISPGIKIVHVMKLICRGEIVNMDPLSWSKIYNFEARCSLS